MHIGEFNYINHFTLQEVLATGADFLKVNYQVLYNLDKFRTDLNSPINLLYNGLNTGVHAKNSYHYKNLAVDFTIRSHNIRNRLPEIMILAGKHEFNGVGIYYNQKSDRYSFHLDLRAKATAWYGFNDQPVYSWDYYDMKITKGDFK